MLYFTSKCCVGVWDRGKKADTNYSKENTETEENKMIIKKIIMQERFIYYIHFGRFLDEKNV